MYILNSSGLVVQVSEAVPTVSPSGTPSWPQGAVGNVQVSPSLGKTIARNSGVGRFSLGSSVTGIRGSILVTFVAGAAGMARTLAYLTDSPTSPTHRIVLGLDAMNRPDISIYDGVGTLKAQVIPTYVGILAGSQNQVLLAWDATQAIDSTRYAVLQVNSSAVPSVDWITNPVAAWSPFQPTDVVLGFGVGTDIDFNGQIVSVQISNDTVVGGPGSGGQFPTTHVFDRFLNDTPGVTST